MESWFHDLLVSGVEHNATEWQILLDKPAVLRIDGSAVKTDLVTDNDTFVNMLSELLPPKQFEKITTDDDGVDFVNENFLYVDEELGRFLLNLQRQRNQLALVIRRPRRDPSVLFDALKYAVEHGASDLHIRENKSSVCGLTASWLKPTL